jgi:anaerobic carbon-monoxide dehydrogenase catalytic subunit
MEFIQKKTADGTVERFLAKAAEREVSLAWDRYEGQLPECGFCETGLSCRDCLQGPCISHPFRDSNKLGVCGKDKDILAIQSLLRLVLKGTMVYLNQLSDLIEGVQSGEVKPNNKGKTDQILKEVQSLLMGGGVQIKKELPKSFIRSWKGTGIFPEGVARDLFKASQKLEGGVTDVEETLLWAFKSSLFGWMASWLHGDLKRSVFGEYPPTKIEVNLGVLRKESPNLLLYGYFSPILKRRIAEEAKKKNVHVTGICTDPFIPPFSFPQVTSYGSQEVPIMTGAVDLIIAGDQFVNPSLANIAKEWEVPIVSAEVLKKEQDIGRFARQIVESAKKSFDFRRNIPRDIPETKEYAMMGFSPGDADARKVVTALNKGKLKGIAILSGSNNVKYTQDQELLTMAQEFLKNDVLCISKGGASVTLAKYGLLNPVWREKNCSKPLADLLSSLGKEVPPILDFGDEGIVDFLLNAAKSGKKELKDYPIVACFPEANRTSEVTEAMWTVAMGIQTYFWPTLPVTGSVKAMEALTKFCEEKFGSKLNVITEKKIDARTKGNMVLKALRGEEGFDMSGKPWK